MSDEYVGLTPDTYTEGGGLVDDVDATITAARFVSYDYNGKAAKPALCLKVNYQPVEGKAFTEYYSCGDLSNFAPSSDGKNIRKVGKATGLNKQSNGAIYLGKAIEADSALTFAPPAGVSALDGRTVHLARIPQPKRGNDASGRQVGKANATLLVITAFHAAGARGKANGAAADAADIQDEATQAILKVLEETPSLTKTKLSQALFKALDGNPHRRDITQMALSGDFLASVDLWKWDGKTISVME